MARVPGHESRVTATASEARLGAAHDHRDRRRARQAGGPTVTVGAASQPGSRCPGSRLPARLQDAVDSEPLPPGWDRTTRESLPAAGTRDQTVTDRDGGQRRP